MHLEYKDRFLTGADDPQQADAQLGIANPREVTIEPGHTGIAIHPSSEVDLVLVDNQHVLSPRSIVPLEPGRQHTLLPIRMPVTYALNGAAVNNAAVEAQNLSMRDAYVGERLVVQCYEKCDPLIAPVAGRIPRYKDAAIAGNKVPAAAAAARLMLRMPMQGRRGCTIGFRRSVSPPAVDFTMILVATKVGRRWYGVGWSGQNADPSNLVSQPSFDGSAPMKTTSLTWFNGGAAPALDYDATIAANRIVTIGGYGDSAETMDELKLYVWGAAGAAIEIFAEAFGDVA